MYAIMTYTRQVHTNDGHSRVYFESVTFTGRVTKAHTDKILAALKNEKYFIPEQVGLPKPGPVGHMVKQCCDHAAHCVKDVCDDCEYKRRLAHTTGWGPCRLGAAVYKIWKNRRKELEIPDRVFLGCDCPPTPRG